MVNFLIQVKSVEKSSSRRKSKERKPHNKTKKKTKNSHYDSDGTDDIVSIIDEDIKR